MDSLGWCQFEKLRDRVTTLEAENAKLREALAQLEAEVRRIAGVVLMIEPMCGRIGTHVSPFTD